MNAKKLFEELGYEYEKHPNSISYSCYGLEIIFIISKKELDIRQNEIQVYVSFSLEETKAIIKQMKELNWLN